MRLDVYLVEHQYFESRNKAASSVKEGNFTVNKKQVFKPSFEVTDGDIVCALKIEKVYVARSAHKLLNAFRQFSLNWEGKVAADLGASTGGFCQVLLENDIKKIYAVDIGTAQLHPSLKADSRVINMEHTNARNLTAVDFDEPIDVVTADLSFISLKIVLPAAFQVLADGGEAVVLVKPQFEAGPAHLSKSGVVADRKVHLHVLNDIAAFARSLGFSVAGISFSGLAGESGNREYLLYLLKNGGKSISIESAAKNAVYGRESMRKIGIIVNPAKDPGLYHLKRVIGQIEAIQYEYQVSCCNADSPEDYPFCTPDECFKNASLVLTLGGDGTLLKAASYAVRFGVPLLGINLGHLGFLAELEENEISSLGTLLKDTFAYSERMMLEIQVLRNGKAVAEMVALNDAVLRSRIGKPADIVIADAENDLLDYFCDGFIVATPTGSTAYSMSAGGPILEPCSKNIVVTPICPHTLGSRSVVFGAEQKEIFMRVTNADQIQAHLEYDGTDWGVLHDGDVVRVFRHHTPLQLISIHKKSFYKVLNDKISRRKL